MHALMLYIVVYTDPLWIW